MLLPALSNARQLAKKAHCISNLKQANEILLSYSNEYNDWIIPADGVLVNGIAKK